MSIITINVSKNAVVIGQELRACRGCLKTECKLHHLKGDIANAYTDFVADPISPDDDYPKFICCVCRAHLLRFHTFRQKCHQAMKSMVKLAQANILTIDTLNRLNKTSLTYPLTQTQIEVDAYDPCNDMYSLMTGPHVQVYNTGQGNLYGPIVLNDPVLHNPTINMTNAQADSIPRNRQEIIAFPLRNTPVNPSILIGQNIQSSTSKDATLMRLDKADNGFENCRTEINYNPPLDPNIGQIKIEMNDLPDDVADNDNLDRNLANIIPASKEEEDKEMAFLDSVVQRESSKTNRRNVEASTADFIKGVTDESNNNANSLDKTDSDDLNTTIVNDEPKKPKNEIKTENDDIVIEENLIHPVDEDDITEHLINKDFVLGVPNLPSLQVNIGGTTNKNEEMTLSMAAPQKDDSSNNKSVKASLVNVTDSVKDSCDNLADENDQEITIDKDIPPNIDENESIIDEIKAEDIVKEENLIHPVDDGEDFINSETSNKDITEVKDTANNVLDLVSSSSDSSDSDTDSDSDSDSDESNDGEVKKLVVSDDEDVYICPFPPTGKLKVTQIKKIMIDEVDLTEHDDDDPPQKLQLAIDKGVTSLPPKPEERKANTKNPDKITKENTLKTPHFETVIVDRKTDTKNPDKITKENTLETPHFETVIVNEVDLTAVDDDDERNKTNEHEEESDAANNANQENMETNENNKEITKDKSKPNSQEKTFVYKNMNVYQSDSDDDCGDLPDCLFGLNSNIYRNDTKRNFPEPKPRKEEIKFADDDDYVRKSSKTKRRSTEKAASKAKVRKKNEKNS